MKVWIYIFKTGFSFPVALIQNEKIKVESISILMGHPVCTEIKLLYFLNTIDNELAKIGHGFSK